MTACQFINLRKEDPCGEDCLTNTQIERKLCKKHLWSFYHPNRVNRFDIKNYIWKKRLNSKDENKILYDLLIDAQCNPQSRRSYDQLLSQAAPEVRDELRQLERDYSKTQNNSAWDSSQRYARTMNQKRFRQGEAEKDFRDMNEDLAIGKSLGDDFSSNDSFIVSDIDSPSESNQSSPSESNQSSPSESNQSSLIDSTEDLFSEYSHTSILDTTDDLSDDLSNDLSDDLSNHGYDSF